MELPKEFTAIYKDKKGNTKYKYTNDETTAVIWRFRYDAEVYKDTRYKAKLRLYWYLWRKKEYKEQ